MRKVLILAILLSSCLAAASQPTVDRLYFDMRASFHQDYDGKDYHAQMVGEHLNFQMLGHITPTLDYRIRQRLNKKVFDERNMFNATDFMYINWQITPRWSLLAGKHAVLIGGYEYDAAPIDVYFYSQFCNNLYQGFTFGASTSFEFAPGQNLVAQVCNSPLSLGLPNIFAYNLAWSGRFAPWWRTIWSVNFVQDADRQMINYIALGNHFVFRNVIFDLDLMNRGGFSQKRFLASDYSVIAKLIWSIGNWNLCGKAGYEANAADNVDENGRPFDLVIAPGTSYFYAGAGLEWFPLREDNLRLHLVYYQDNAIHTGNLELGVTWRIDVIKNNALSLWRKNKIKEGEVGADGFEPPTLCL